LVVRALKKYIKSEPVRKEKAESAKSLGEVIKRYRTQRKMTQEFVAESLGVSRQAVSKWESGGRKCHKNSKVMAESATVSVIVVVH
jgi:DNA-binding transcriptional regulator YiaG